MILVHAATESKYSAYAAVKSDGRIINYEE